MIRTVTPADGPELPRRGFPALTSPPFPFSDWPYGGSPVIGATDTSGGPLMTAIYGKHGKSWENSRIKIYGWINAGINLSTSNAHYGNAPASYYMSQLRSNWTRLLSMSNESLTPSSMTISTGDSGSRSFMPYGLSLHDGKRLFQPATAEKNNGYGYDPVMAYVDLYFGQVANEMQTSASDIYFCQILKPNSRPTIHYSHSILYTFDAYTQTGINVTTKLERPLDVPGWYSAGNDVRSELVGEQCQAHS